MPKITPIRSLGRNFPMIRANTPFYFGVRVSTLSKVVIDKVGFQKARHGDTIIPPASFGHISDYNVNGTFIQDKSGDKESFTYAIKWQWEEWRGKERIQKEGVKYRTGHRWPRKPIPAPSIELTYSTTVKGDKVIISPLLKHTTQDEKLNCHAANLFREIFGMPIVYSENISEIVKAPIRRINWQVLPPGKMPWSKLKNLLPVYPTKTPNQKYVIDHRFAMINQFEPSFVAIGQGGFQGYVVFGFSKKKLFVLESMHHDNATYVFSKQWKILSQKTKAEILQKGLAKDRLIHQNGWEAQIKKLLS